MRFNIKADVYKVDKRKDGQGGYIENKSLYKSMYCHVCALRIEKQMQLFGVVNYSSVSLTTMDIIDIDNFYILIDGVYYKPLHKPKAIKNKTYITLDVLENAD